MSTPRRATSRPQFPSLAARSRQLLRLATGSLVALAAAGAAAPPALSQTQVERPEWDSFVAGQATRIGSHRYFSKVAFDRFEPDEQHVVFVQKNPAAKEGVAEQIVAANLKWMLEVEAEFMGRIAVPAQLKRSNEGAPHVLLVLNTSGDYANFLSTFHGSCAAFRGAGYDPFLSATVTFTQSFGKKLSPKIKRQDQRHAFMHSLQQAWGKSGFQLPGPEWLAEGQAVLGSLATWYDKPPATPGALPASIVSMLVKLEQEGGHAKGALRSIKDLVKPERRKTFRQPLQNSGKLFWPHLTSLSFQCGAFVHFLMEAEDGKRRDLLATFEGRAMNARGSGANAVAAAFGDLDQLDKEFWAYLHSEHMRLHPEFDPKAARPKAVGTAAAAPIEASFDPASLAFTPEEGDALFGLALYEARSGRLDAAATRLAKLVENSEDSRAEREGQRVTDLLAARDAFIAYLVESGEKLRVELEEGKLSAQVKGFEAGVLTLGSNRLDLEKLPIERVGLVELVRAMGKEDPEFGSDLTLAYAYALEEDGRLKTKLRRVEDDGGLLKDAMSMGSHSAVGLLSADIERCSQVNLDELDTAQAEAVVESLSRLAPYSGDIPFVKARRQGLKRLAEEAYSVILDAAPLEQLMGGKLERLDGGRVRLTYDFSDPAQLQDFVRDDAYQARYRATFPTTDVDATKTSCDVESGSLNLFGAVGLRLPLNFKGPQRLNYEFAVGSEDSTSSSLYYAIIASICDDRQGSWVSNFNFGGLIALDLRTKTRDVSDVTAGQQLYLGQPYRFALDHSGDRTTWILDDVPQNSVAVGELTEGEVFILAHTNAMIQITELSIEGVIDGSSRLRVRLVNERVAALFGD